MKKFALSAVLFAFSIHTFAATVDVTTTNDVLDAGDCSVFTITDLTSNPGTDGFISLREAVCAANNTKGADEINLPAGIYALTLGGSGENANLEGDLDVTDTLTIRGDNPTTTFIENGIGDAQTQGDGDRVIEVGSGFMTGIDLALEDVTVRFGDLSCTGIECFTGAAGIHFESDGTLSFLRAGVSDNQTSCTGDCCGNRDNTGGIMMRNVGRLEFTDGFLSRNNASCEFTGKSLPTCHTDDSNATCQAGTSALYVGDDQSTDTTFDMVMTNSVIDGNTVNCTGDQCGSDEVVTIQNGLDIANITLTDVEVTNNSASCTGFDCDSDEVFESDISGERILTRVLFSGNRLECHGDECDTDELLSLDGNNQSVTTIDSRFVDNVHNCEGFNCDTDELFEMDSEGDKTVIRTVIADNQQTCIGEDCDTDELLSLCCGSGDKLLQNLQVLRNTHYCIGSICDVDEIVEIGTNNGFTADVVNSVIANNSSSCEGTDCSCDVAGVHFLSSGGDNSMRNTTISGNQSIGDDSNGGCINRSTGGILNNSDDLYIVNTTIINNQAVGSGAGIINKGTIVMDHSTITNNTADVDNNGVGFGGGICSDLEINGNSLCGFTSSNPTSITISNSIIADNNNVAPDCFGIINSDGFNIIGDSTNCQLFGNFLETDPMLMPLADNGCSFPQPDGSCAQTQLPEENSPAIDAGSCVTSGASDDQRGFFRPFDVPGVLNADDGCDIGAVELNTDLIFANGFEF